MKRIAFVTSEQFLDHLTPTGHPEQPRRLSSLVDYLQRTSLWEKLDHRTPRAAGITDILRVHSTSHVENIRSICQKGGGLLDEGDTHASEKSYDVALLAAGGVCSAVDAVLDERMDGAFCAVRPPGHHAERDRPMGFCLFNNVAIGARYAQEHHGIERVAILDWDVHHGNGTQHTFEDDPTVLFISLHQYPFYPGTGSREEKGLGAGEGYTMNFPMEAGSTEEHYVQVFTQTIVPALRRFAPGLLFISAGFDAHRDDPLADIRLTESSYGTMTGLIKEIAPVVSVMEGGYNLEATARSVEKHLNAMF